MLTRAMVWTRAWVASVAIGLVAPAAVHAEAVSAQAQVSRQQTEVGEPIQLRVTVRGVQRIQPPEISIDGADVQYLGPSTSVSIVNGAMSSSISHLYAVTPQHEGRLTIGPIDIQADGQVIQTQPITIEVGPSAWTQSPGAGGAQGRADDERPLRLQIAVDKPKAYVNEAVRAKIQLLVGGAVVRGIEMPKLEAEGFLVKPIGRPTQSEILIDGETWHLVEFETDVVPIRAGSLTLGPASLECQVAVRRPGARRRGAFGEDPFGDLFGPGSVLEDFFGPHSLKQIRLTGDPVIVDVQPLPTEARPEDFTGAVGRFSLDRQVTPTEVAVGEPITVTTIVAGTGNFDAVSAPRLPLDPSKWKVYEPTSRTGTDSQPGTGEQQKVFEQVVIPLDPSLAELPPSRFSCFDPTDGRYHTIGQGPTPIRVRPAAAQAPAPVIGQAPASPSPRAAPEPLGRDIVYIKDRLGPWHDPRGPWQRPVWWIAQLLALGMLAASEALWWRRRRAANDPAVRASGALGRALARGHAALQRHEDDAAFCTELFRALQQYLADRLGVPIEGLTRPELEALLAPRRMPPELLRDLLDLIDRCDAARFAPVPTSDAESRRGLWTEAEALLRRLDRWRPT